MKVAALLAALWALGCSTVTTLVRTGSAIRTRHDHLGVRVSSDDPRDWGVTVQWSTDRLP